MDKPPDPSPRAETPLESSQEEEDRIFKAACATVREFKAAGLLQMKEDHPPKAGETRVDENDTVGSPESAARAVKLFERLYTQPGPIGDLVTEAAKRVAKGEDPEAVSSSIYPKITRYLQAHLALDEELLHLVTSETSHLDPSLLPPRSPKREAELDHTRAGVKDRLQRDLLQAKSPPTPDHTDREETAELHNSRADKHPRPVQHTRSNRTYFWEPFQDRGTRLMDLVDAAPPWVQGVWKFVMLGCLGAVGGQVWYMTFGDVILVAFTLLVAALVLGRWRWGLLSFVVVGGTVWVIRARYPAAAALVSIACVTLTAMFTLPQARPQQHR